MRVSFISKLFVGVAAASMAFAVPVPASQKADYSKQIRRATELMQSLRSSPKIPRQVLENSAGLAVFPDVVEVAALVGGRHGEGVFVQNKNGKWSAPILVALTGGSLGAQAGIEQSDIVLVFRDSGSVDKLLAGKFTLGADATVTAGPVGWVSARSAGAEADIVSQGILSYDFDKRGLLVSAALDGTSLTVPRDVNEEFYGKPGITARQILQGQDVRVPQLAQNFQQSVTQYYAAAEKGGGKQRQTIVGKVQRVGDRYLLASNLGEFALSGRDFSDLTGKRVEVTGNVYEADGQQTIEVISATQVGTSAGQAGAPMGLSSSTVREIQQELQSKGFNPGPIDGQWGPQTSRAITEFQRSADLTPDGEPNRKTLQALGIEADQEMTRGYYGEEGPGSQEPGQQEEPSGAEAM
ncbi:MAG: YSC84-related protein [bacterium]